MPFRRLILLLLLLLPESCLSLVPFSIRHAVAASSNCPETTTFDVDEDTHLSTRQKLTSALLQISYDGRHFTGWSAANDPKVEPYAQPQPLPTVQSQAIVKASRRRRRNKGSGFVRSVQGVLRSNLAKLYGNIEPNRVIIEGCSRTDKGVHATGMVAQFYVLKQNYYSVDYELSSIQQPSIPGKRTPHPWNATDDSLFEYIPRSLEDLTFALNRMCHDIQIRAYAPIPCKRTNTTNDIPFHPTRSARWKVYRYTFSVGKIHDPTQHRWVWHATNSIDKGKVERACQIMQGTHDFAAFQGAARGSDEKMKRKQRGTRCTIDQATIETISHWHNLTTTFQLEIKGDRFLYKMVRFLVGALVAIGNDKLELNEFENMIKTGSRNGRKFPCAPSHALTLQKVVYNGPIDWEMAEK